jgi:UPF0042 nucleotide-binding protein
VRIVIVSGMSGAGKSHAIRVLEDSGFYCVDNLPVMLLSTFADLCRQSSHEISKAALGVDIREREFLKELPAAVRLLTSKGIHVDLIYLEAADDVLVRRFRESRRPHPLGIDIPLAEGIARERAVLAEIRSAADLVIDTSSLSVRRLREMIEEYMGRVAAERGMQVSLLSFGYKFGVPNDADVVLDLRFLPNPFFVEGLRDLTGNDPSVSSYVLDRPETSQFLDRLRSFLDYLLPLYQQEGKSYLTIALGCTGGQHRSVAVVNRLAGELRGLGRAVVVRHRDLSPSSAGCEAIETPLPPGEGRVRGGEVGR